MVNSRGTRGALLLVVVTFVVGMGLTIGLTWVGMQVRDGDGSWISDFTLVLLTVTGLFAIGSYLLQVRLSNDLAPTPEPIGWYLLGFAPAATLYLFGDGDARSSWLVAACLAVSLLAGKQGNRSIGDPKSRPAHDTSPPDA